MIIDRFEEHFAVCELENGEMINIDKKRLPKNAREGSVLKEESGNLVLDFEEEKKLKEKIKALEDNLFE